MLKSCYSKLRQILKYLISIFLFINFLYANSSTLVLEDEFSFNENFEISYLKDSSNELNIQEVANSKDFQKHSNNFSLGYLPDTIWIKVDLKNKSSKEDFILSINEHFYEKANMHNVMNVIFYLSVAFVLVAGEELLTGIIPFSGLLAVMAAGVAFQSKQPTRGVQLSSSFNQIWKGAEILLFVLVGATVNITYAFGAGFSAVGLIAVILVFRLVGVYVSLIGTDLNFKEKIFCMISALPKATVQAAIGGVPLAMGLPFGELILTIAVVSILITAPIGAGLIDLMHEKLLSKDPKKA